MHIIHAQVLPGDTILSATSYLILYDNLSEIVFTHEIIEES